MNKGDGSMTFDWILYAILVIPMIFAAWELYKSSRAPRDGSVSRSGILGSNTLPKDRL